MDDSIYPEQLTYDQALQLIQILIQKDNARTMATQSMLNDVGETRNLDQIKSELGNYAECLNDISQSAFEKMIAITGQTKKN